MSASIDTEKRFNKSQTLFIIKTQQPTVSESAWNNEFLDKVHSANKCKYKKPTASILSVLCF